MTHPIQGQVKSLKIPPHSIDAEQSVIGGLLMDNSSIEKVSDILNISDFYKTEHSIIYDAILQLHAKNKPFDLLTVSDVLQVQRMIDQAGGEAYLYDIAGRVPTTANIVAYAEIVVDRSIMRRLIKVGNTITDSAFDSKERTSDDLLNDAEREVLSIGDCRTRRSEPLKGSQLMSKLFEKLSDSKSDSWELPGIKTGFTELDKTTMGMQRGDLVILAARPSMGKTCLAMNIVEDVVINQSKNALVFSMEMSSEKIALRLLSSMSRISSNRIRFASAPDSMLNEMKIAKLTKDEWTRLATSVSKFASAKFFVDDQGALTPSDVLARSRRVKHQLGGQLDLIVVDYLQLMTVKGFRENRTQEVSLISRNLKNLARELNVPVLALSQLNRSLESRGDRRPIMSDIRESGSVEQDADVIAFIYRDEVYNKDSHDKGIAEIILAKQRDGEIGTVKLAFHGKYTRFENLENKEYYYG